MDSQLEKHSFLILCIQIIAKLVNHIHAHAQLWSLIPRPFYYFKIFSLGSVGARL